MNRAPCRGILRLIYRDRGGRSGAAKYLAILSDGNANSAVQMPSNYSITDPITNNSSPPVMTGAIRHWPRRAARRPTASPW
jgi:hypothetical protein